jgi:hypothetical protein
MWLEYYQKLRESRYANHSKIAINNVRSDPELRNVFLGAMGIDDMLLTPVHRRGEFKIGADSVPVIALFDSGALSGNYMSTDFFNANVKDLLPVSDLVDSTAIVVMADGVTRSAVLGVFTLPLRFTYDDHTIVSDLVKVSVLDMSENQLIIGLPSIISTFSILFKHMIDAAIPEFARAVHQADRRINNISVVSEVPDSLNNGICSSDQLSAVSCQSCCNNWFWPK